MPNIQSAKKKLRKDLKRTKSNDAFKKKVSKTVKDITKMGAKTTKGTLEKAYSIIDKSVKKNIMHRNKAARLKSRLSKLLSKK